ncbi:hypothetical protein MMC08_005048 [Hypocenomyce scalaris]|nr:hypothetical protein [Hypocenomyce scalaris]
MASSHTPDEADEAFENEEAMLDPNEAAEEIPSDPDQSMDSDPEDDPQGEEIHLQNDSTAHFDKHTDSIFCIAQHPLDPSIIATGAGDDTAYIFSSITRSTPLPPSYESNPSPSRDSLEPLAKLSGHTDSINALAFTLPNGDYLVTAGLDGRLRTYSPAHGYAFLAEAQEVEEINWLAPSPHPSHPNTVALGASDGSVWVYTVSPTTDPTAPGLQVLQAYYLHTASCTAGVWAPDGKLLCTVSEDSSFYVYDVFGEASAAGITSASHGGQAVVGLTADDQRFAVEDGLYSVAVAPTGAFAAVGGAGGMIRVVGLPRLGSATDGTSSDTQRQRGGGAKNKAGGGRKVGGPETAEGTSAGQAGHILASLQAQGDGVETLAFSTPPLTLLAAGSVDGSVALFDWAHRFAVRRHIRDAHEEYAVVKVEFVAPIGLAGQTADGGWLLTTCGMDGVMRRWDTRGGTAASGQGLVGEWRGHRGEGEGGGVLGFVQKGGRIVTAGDDGVSLVFDARGA